jgi:hypothetical protein
VLAEAVERHRGRLEYGTQRWGDCRGGHA